MRPRRPAAHLNANIVSIMRYCIVYVAQQEAVQKYFNDITATLSDKFGIANLSKRVPPHLTLKYPFESDDFTSIEKAVENAVVGKSPFPISIDGFSRFPNSTNTIFMDIRISENNLSAVKKIITDLGEFDEDRKFDIDDHKPHMSIVRKLEPQVFNLVWDYVTKLPKPYIDLTFENVTILVREGDVWNIKKMFRIS